MQRLPQQKSSRDRHGQQLQKIITDVVFKLADLASQGRPGQWILHNEELYHPTMDTRPQSRKPNEETPVPRLRYPEKGLVWAGKGPTPDLSDIAFWEAKRMDLDDKIRRVKARLVQPRFTPAELDTLESLEQQSGHFFRTELFRRQDRLRNAKKHVFNVLFSFAKLGRPGQWVLHGEELYHHTIDTRPATRAAENSIAIRGTTHRRIRGDWVAFDFELTWAGTGPPPDFDDIDYWEGKYADLADKVRQVEQGLVHPRFTSRELRALQAMEADQDHAFAILAKNAREKPPVADTAEPLAARKKLFEAQSMVVTVMEDLWYAGGLAGKWVLRNEDLYLPSYDTRFRAQEDGDDGDGDIRRACIVIEDDLGLCFDSRFRAPPDFKSVSYWEAKRAELRAKRDDIAAGRLTTHRFSEGDLMRIELLERAILEKLERPVHDDSTAERVATWLNGGAKETQQLPPARSPTPKPAVQSAPDAAEQRVDVEHRQTRSVGASKRKRAADGEDDEPPAARPTKRSKAQPRQQPTSAESAMQGRPRAAASASRRRGGLPADRPAGGAADSSVDRPPLRRSARIAAQPPRSRK